MAKVNIEIVGQTIKQIRKMTAAELKYEGWERCEKPTVIVLENGIKLYASMDPEGNGPGCLIGKTKDGNSFFA